MNASFFIKTYGCQMNDYDSEKINELLSSHGYRETLEIEKSDIAILNTCHIREKATEKLYSDLGRLSVFKENKKRSGKDMKIIVTGCVAQAEGKEIIKRNKAVDLVLGPQNFHVIAKVLKKELKKKTYTDFLGNEKFESFPVSNNKNVSRLVTIQEGCDKFCSFCVVPYTRGAEYCRSVEDIYAEVLNLVKNGAMEVVLLGQNVSAYKSRIFEGKSLKNVGLNDLCNVLSDIRGLKRIRYITSHPNDINNDLIQEHKKNKKMMPFLHLPVQSGSNRILKEMNRKHTREEYLEIINKIRISRPDFAFSSDFIVGYPGETERDFQDTLDLIEKVKFASSYSFRYSPRPGTPSSLKQNFVDDKKVAIRLQKIQRLLLEQQNEFNSELLGKTSEVLITGKAKKENQYVGRTAYLQPVHIYSSRNVTGKILKTKIEKLTAFSFHGKIIN